MRSFTKEDSIFTWDDTYQSAYQKLKEKVVSAMSLKYFNSSAKTILEVDSLLKVLGAAIVQNAPPVAFASKALTDTVTVQ